jgi:hypothetical protein
VAEAIELNETELTALSEVALGNTPDPASEALSALIKRGLASIDGAEVTFSEELRAAFEAMATCRLNLVLMNDGGNPGEQFYIGDEGSAARVLGDDSGLTIQRLDLEAIPGEVVNGLVALLANPGTSELPNPENFAEVSAALDMDGLVAKAWCGLVQSRPAPEGQEGRYEQLDPDRQVRDRLRLAGPRGLRAGLRRERRRARGIRRRADQRQLTVGRRLPIVSR